MFLEHTGNRSPRRGWIEVICGSMFSGKTEELIRRLRRAEFAKQRVEVFKPSVDTRYAKAEVVSHDSTSLRGKPVGSSAELLRLPEDVEVVGLDEAQFFDEGLPAVCAELSSKGVRVIAAGLDMDFLGRPFGPMPHLLSMAEYVTKVHAICVRCGALAAFSHRISAGSDLVQLGEKDSYEPLCRVCFDQARATAVLAR
ncbi:MAG: thymidine kinase [Flavobacteriales bacterium]|mgnify:CR=1 FL=1|jgi:thymidine kinase|nr:thymidine kinase [Flavobacteriales bacterium]